METGKISRGHWVYRKGAWRQTISLQVGEESFDGSACLLQMQCEGRTFPELAVELRSESDRAVRRLLEQAGLNGS